MKRLLKTVIVFIVILSVPLNCCLSSYAFAGAPAVIAAEELGAVFAGLLSANGVPQEQIDGMSLDDKRVMCETGVNNGTLTPTADYMNWLLSNNRASEIESGVKSPAQAAESVKQGVNDWWDYWQESGGTVADYFHEQPANMHGYNVPDVDLSGALVIAEHRNSGQYEVYVCHDVVFNDNTATCHQADVYTYDKNGNLLSVRYNQNCAFGVNWNYYDYYFYGDISNAPSNVNVESIDGEYVIGEADGVSITPEMVDEHGNVTINGATYTPVQYINPAKVKDEALADMMKKILAKLNAMTVTEDVPIGNVEVPEIELEISELNKLTVPQMITTVFPFCLPWDFVRGLKLLSEKPTAPRFEIPFEIPSFGFFEGQSYTIVFDMSEYSQYFEVLRWLEVVMFMIGLCFVSFKIVKGVH